MLAAVGIDLDGTLMDHPSAMTRAMSLWASSHGWAEAPALDAWRAAEKRHFPSFVAGAISFDEQRRRRVADLLAAMGDDPDEWDLALAFSEYLAHYEQSWVAYPDAIPALAECRMAGLRIGVLTNGDRAQQVRKLSVIGLLDMVDAVVASSDLAAGKPDRRAFQALCEVLGSEPSATLFIGDDLAADVEGAAAAGLLPVWLNRSGDGAAHPWHEVSSLVEVGPLLTD